MEGNRRVEMDAQLITRGKREEGRGKREEGRGKREEGRGKREEGRGKREDNQCSVCSSFFKARSAVL